MDSLESQHVLATPRDHQLADASPVEIRRFQRRDRMNLRTSMESRLAHRRHEPSASNRAWSAHDHETPKRRRSRTNPHSDSAEKVATDFRAWSPPPYSPAVQPGSLPSREPFVVPRPPLQK